jgi:hypothetical protein
MIELTGRVEDAMHVRRVALVLSERATRTAKELLHRHRLRQIPRLIHIRAFEDGAVVRQQL